MKNKTKTDKQKQNTTRNETIKQNKNKNSETNKRVSRPCHIAPPPRQLAVLPQTRRFLCQPENASLLC